MFIYWLTDLLVFTWRQPIGGLKFPNTSCFNSTECPNFINTLCIFMIFFVFCCSSPNVLEFSYLSVIVKICQHFKVYYENTELILWFCCWWMRNFWICLFEKSIIKKLFKHLLPFFFGFVFLGYLIKFSLSARFS